MDVVPGNNLNTLSLAQFVESPQDKKLPETEAQTTSTDDIVTISEDARQLQQRSGDDNGTKPK